MVQHRVPGFAQDWVISEIPVPEAAWHDAAIELLKALLDHWIRRSARDAMMFRNLAIRVREDNPRVGFDPDLALVQPAPPEGRELSSLRLWEPGHAVPALVIEVVSPGHPTKDYTQTPDQCAALGVRELVVFDPKRAGPKAHGSAQRLHLWRRSEAGVFERVHTGDGPFGSEVLDAYLQVMPDGRSLRVATDTGGTKPWPTEAEDAHTAQQSAERDREAALLREREAAVRERDALARIQELEAELERRR
jgi:Uma2 family endonuclease